MIGPCRTPGEEGFAHNVGDLMPGAEHTRPWVLAVAIFGSSLTFIDGSVVNVALPVIQRDLDVSIAGAQWVVNSYMLSLSALILIGGAAGDRFGRRFVFALGVALFALASLACGVAPGVATLIAARFAQGVGGALLVPGSLAIIGTAFPGDARGKAIGTWAGFSALTTALGPVVGGWLVDALSWRAIFFINLPLAAATLALYYRHVTESRNDAPSPEPLDWQDGVLATIGLGGVAYGLTAGPALGWTHPAVLSALLAGTLVLFLFFYRDARAAAPMIPLRLFRSARFSGANAVTLLLYVALSGALFLLPFNLIRFQGYTAAEAGAAFLPFTIVMGALSRWAGGLAQRYGARTPLVIGQAIAAAGFALFALPGIGRSYWTTFFPAMALLGLGMAVSVPPLTTTVMSAVEGRYAGIASGINNAIARVAGMLAVALLGAAAVGVFGASLDRRLGELRVPPELRRAVAAEAAMLDQATVASNVGDGSQPAIEQAVDQSFLLSFRVVMLVATGLALAGAQCAWLAMRPPRPAGNV